MEINRIVKPVVVGGVAAATMFSPIQPLRMLDVGNEVAYAANDITLPVSTFKPTGAKFYVGTTFQDVAANMWYTDAVKQAYEYGLITGKSANAYEPEGDLTVAETITLAVKLHSYGTTGGYNIPTGTNPWYNNIVNYAVQNGIITASEFMGQYDNKATREQVAHIFSKVFGEGMLPKINAVSSLPDVKPSDKYASDIYELYEAGILSGSDSKGTFNPKSHITRAEIASIVMRMALPTQRVSLDIFNGVGAPKSDTFPSVSNGAVSKPNTGSNSADTDNNSSTNSNSNNNNNNNSTTDNTTDKPNSGTNTNIGTTKPNTGSSNNNNNSSSTGSSNNNNNNDNNTDKPSTPQPITIDGIEYVPDVTGAYYVYCDSDTNLSKLTLENGDKLTDYLSPGVKASDMIYSKTAENVFVYSLEIPDSAPSDMKTVYFIASYVKEGSTTPNPDEYADWFFNVYRSGERKVMSGSYDALPSNYQECARAIINVLREKEGADLVSIEPKLCEAAEIRAAELAISFGHTRPNGEPFYTACDDLGYFYASGENATGYNTLVRAISAWIDSPGHYKNMATVGNRFGIGFDKEGGSILILGRE